MGCIQSNIKNIDKDVSVKKTKVLEHIDMYKNHNIKRRSLEYERKNLGNNFN